MFGFGCIAMQRRLGIWGRETELTVYSDARCLVLRESSSNFAAKVDAHSTQHPTPSRKCSLRNVAVTSRDQSASTRRGRACAGRCLGNTCAAQSTKVHSSKCNVIQAIHSCVRKVQETLVLHWRQGEQGATTGGISEVPQIQSEGPASERRVCFAVLSRCGLGWAHLKTCSATRVSGCLLALCTILEANNSTSVPAERSDQATRRCNPRATDDRNKDDAARH